MPDGEANKRISLADTAFERLSSMITSGEIAPGEHMTERMLADDLGLGLTPIREALARLAQAHLVTIIPRRGYVVAPVTVENVDAIFEVWRYVCAMIAELAAKKATAADIEALTALTSGRRKRAPARTPLAELEFGQRLYGQLGRIAGNPILSRLFDDLSLQVSRLFVLVFRDNAAMPAPPESGTLVDLIARGDAVGARENALLFNDAVHERLRELLAPAEG